MCFITDMLTAPGTNAAMTQNEQNAALSDYVMKNLMPAIQNLLTMQSKTGPEYEAARQNAVKLLIDTLNPSNLAAQDTAQKAAITQNTATGTRQSVLQGQAAGLSPAAQGGIVQGMAGQGVRAQTQVDQNSLDPQKAAARVSAWLSAIEQGQKMPAMNDFMNLSNVISGQPKANVQPGFGSILGGMAGNLASAGTGGGGGGGSMGIVSTLPPGL